MYLDEHGDHTETINNYLAIPVDVDKYRNSQATS